MKSNQKFLVASVLIAMTYTLYAISRYWYADTLYAKGTRQSILKAISISPNEPLYHLKLAQIHTDSKEAIPAIIEAKKAEALSLSNINIKRQIFTIYLKLSLIDPKYLVNAIETLEQAIQMAPTDAKLFYNLGLTYERIGDREKATEAVQKSIEMKPNYKEARLAQAFFLIDEKKYSAARDQLNYILTNIDHIDELTKETLNGIISQ